MALQITPTSNGERLLWDIETDGLQEEATVIWCMSILDIDSGDVQLYTDHDEDFPSLTEGLQRISKAGVWVNHNIIPFDEVIIERLYPWVTRPTCVVDTLLLSRLLYSEIHEYKALNKGLSKQLKMSHSLDAWGHRLNQKKGEYSDWSRYTKEMGRYCMQDTVVTWELLKHLEKRGKNLGLDIYATEDITTCIGIEHQFLRLTMRQTVTGIPFNVRGAEELTAFLIGKRDELKTTLQGVFPPVFMWKELKTKCNIWWEPFNPGSRQQIGDRLVELGWEPADYTASGQPKIDETTLSGSAIPEAMLIAEYLTVDKRLGQIANGKNAWLKLVKKDGRIHHTVKTLTANTGRVSHANPNLSQVPAVGTWLGEECRSLFMPKDGWVMVGCDLSGVELRALAHFLHRYDSGQYVDYVIDGDVHTVHQQAFGLPEGKEYRGIGKRGTYCLIYGGGDWKLGYSLGFTGTQAEVAAAGKKARANLMRTLPALSSLTTAVKDKMRSNDNVLRGLDRRPLKCRAEHSAINVLLQSAGTAVLSKCWYVHFAQEMDRLGYVHGESWSCLGFFHDEIQVDCREDIAEDIGQILVRTAAESGKLLGLRCPIDAEYSVGGNWAETH